MQSIHSRLDEVGDPDAPPGTAAWAQHRRLKLQAAINDDRFNHRMMKSTRDALKRNDAWAVLTDEHGQPFVSFAEFSRTPQPFGLGIEEHLLEEVIEERRALQTNGGDRKSQTYKDQNVNSHSDPVKLGSGRAEYNRARLARDRPDLLERFERGEIRSAHAAAIEAGFVKPRAWPRPSLKGPYDGTVAMIRRRAPDHSYGAAPKPHPAISVSQPGPADGRVRRASVLSRPRRIYSIRRAATA